MLIAVVDCDETPCLIVEEKSSRATGFRLAIDLEINVLENTGLRWRRAFLRKLRRSSRFRFNLRVDGFVLFLGQDLFGHEPVLEEANRIMLVLVFLDLLRLAIAALVLWHRPPNGRSNGRCRIR